MEVCGKLNTVGHGLRRTEQSRTDGKILQFSATSAGVRVAAELKDVGVQFCWVQFCGKNLQFSSASRAREIGEN